MTVIYNMSIDRADKPWIGDRRLTEVPVQLYSCTRLGSLAGRASALRFCRSLALSRSFAVRRPADPADPADPAAFRLIFKRWCEKLQKSV